MGDSETSTASPRALYVTTTHADGDTPLPHYLVIVFIITSKFSIHTVVDCVIYFFVYEICVCLCLTLALIYHVFCVY